jgi:hypothetical protein
MHAPVPTKAHYRQPTEDHLVQLHGVTWEDYERLLVMRGDKSAPKSATSRERSRS